MNYRRRLVLAGTIIFLAASTFSGWRAVGQSGGSAPAPNKRVRIGFYDSRIVAVAFASSALHNNHLKAMMAERDRAQAAGDRKRVAELESEGQRSQVKKHLQAFSNFPVDDVMAEIKTDLPRIAQESGVVAIVSSVNYVSPEAEAVDITDRLIEPFKPDERVKKIAKELRTQPPLDPALVLSHKD